MNLDLVVFIVIENLYRVGEGVADDKFVTLFVKKGYDRPSAIWLAVCRHQAVYLFLKRG